MSFKEIEVRLLPTDEVTGICTDTRSNSHPNLLSFHKPNWQDNLGTRDGYTQNFNLYFLSNEEIKEGDYIGCPSLKDWVPVQYLGGDLTGKERKIISTTDTSLIIEVKDNFLSKESPTGTLLDYYPQPCVEFLKEYIDEYNAGRPITKVMCLYEEDTYATGIKDFKEEGYWRLKVSKDNTITIKKTKDTWNREEVKNLLHKCWIQATRKTLEPLSEEGFTNFLQHNF